VKPRGGEPETDSACGGGVDAGEARVRPVEPAGDQALGVDAPGKELVDSARVSGQDEHRGARGGVSKCRGERRALVEAARFGRAGKREYPRVREIYDQHLGQLHWRQRPEGSADAGGFGLEPGAAADRDGGRSGSGRRQLEIAAAFEGRQVDDGRDAALGEPGEHRRRALERRLPVGCCDRPVTMTLRRVEQAFSDEDALG
jgi:hypothetical protein